MKLYGQILCEALIVHEGNVSNGGQLITNSDIVVNADEEEEAGIQVNRFDTTTARYNKLKIGPEQMKVMTNNPNDFQR